MFLLSASFYVALFLFLGIIIYHLTTKNDNPIKFISKYAIYYIWSSLVAIVQIPILILRPKDIRNMLFLSASLKHATRFMGIKWEVRNEHILVKERACIVVANHQSVIDILGMFNFWHALGKCITIAKKEIFYAWPCGLALYLGGVVFIDRKNSQESYRKLNEAKHLMLQNKTKIFLFPEGTRNTQECSMLPFKRGAFKLAIEAKVPIIPLVYSPYYFINPKKNFFDKGRMIVTCLPPIQTKDMTMDNVDGLMECIRDLMLDCYNNVTKEVLSTLPANYPLIEE